VPLVVSYPDAPAERVRLSDRQIDIEPTIVDLWARRRRAAGRVAVRVSPTSRKEGNLDARDVSLVCRGDPKRTCATNAMITGASPGMKLIHFGGKAIYLYYILAKDSEANDDLASYPALLGSRSSTGETSAKSRL